MDQFLAILHNPAVLSVAAMAAEAAMRAWPTAKPWSIAHIVAAGAHKVADGVSAFAEFLDKVLPQNTAK